MDIFHDEVISPCN